MVLKVRKNNSPIPLCPIGECMRFLGGAWTPNIIWNLTGGPRRFSELRLDIPAVSAKVLSARLKELESIGILERNVQPTSPPSVEYELTPLGRELIPAIEAIASVGKRLKRVQRAPQTEASNRPTPATTSAIPRSSRAVAR